MSVPLFPSISKAPSGRVLQQFHTGTFTKTSRKSKFRQNRTKMSGILHGPQNSFYCCRREVRHGKHFTHLSILYIVLLNNTHRTHCYDGNAPMIKLMRHNLMFYVHCLSCSITHSFKRQIRYKQENQKKKETHRA
jgi:hypothetical protein